VQQRAKSSLDVFRASSAAAPVSDAATTGAPAANHGAQTSRAPFPAETAAEIDEAAILEACTQAARAAGMELDKMRLLEGTKLAEDIAMRAGMVSEHIDIIEQRAPELPKIYAEKLKQRIAEISGIEHDNDIFRQRIAVETATMADKCNITEEIVRLRSHIAQLTEITSGTSNASGGAIGKKLDFIIQEMNREANTIGSKANDLKITNLMLEMKSEIEKIREQVQNIE
jgi:uncharacterized protein (TIGR00255 family)